MELKVEKSRVLSAANKCPQAKDVLKEMFPEAFKKINYTDIKTFEDACEITGESISEELQNMLTYDELCYKQLKIIVKAINMTDGKVWVPDWNNGNEQKWWAYFNFSGSGFSDSLSFTFYLYGVAGVGSRLCFLSKERCVYAATQFSELYKGLLK